MSTVAGVVNQRWAKKKAMALFCAGRVNTRLKRKWKYRTLGICGKLYQDVGKRNPGKRQKWTQSIK